MKLETIIKETAARMEASGVSVETDSAYSTVCISDDSGMNEDIFMQGEEADDFINEVNEVYEKVQTLGRGVIELYVAHEYTECLWS